MPHIQDIGVMMQGCAVPHTHLNTSQTSVTLYTPPDSRIDGWYFVTDATDPQYDPVNFTLSASRDMIHWYEFILVCTVLVSSTPGINSSLCTFDMRPSAVVPAHVCIVFPLSLSVFLSPLTHTHSLSLSLSLSLLVFEITCFECVCKDML
jgi:hypothetical protein